MDFNSFLQGLGSLSQESEKLNQLQTSQEALYNLTPASPHKEQVEAIKEQTAFIEQSSKKIEELNQQVLELKQQLKEESENNALALKKESEKSVIALKKEHRFTVFWSVTCAIISGAVGVIIGKLI